MTTHEVDAPASPERSQESSMPKCRHPVRCAFVVETDEGTGNLCATLHLESDDPSEELRFVLNTLAPGDGFIDVGAHVGYFTLPAARKVGERGRVIAIEPTPSSAAILRENVALNSFGAVTVIEAAASCRSGTGQLTTSSTSAMWNTLERETLPDATSVEVAVRTIDEIVASCGSPSVRLLKLDVEGHERDVFLGAVATMKQNPRLEILFEVWVATQSANATRA